MAKKVKISNDRPTLDNTYIEEKKTIEDKKSSISNEHYKSTERKNMFLLVLVIISIIANGILGYLVYDYYNKGKELESTKKELSSVRSDLNSARNDLYDITGFKTKYYIKNKLEFMDDNIVFRIKGFGNYYYTYDCMMEKVNGSYEYWAYNKEAAISEGLRAGGC